MLESSSVLYPTMHKEITCCLPRRLKNPSTQRFAVGTAATRCCVLSIWTRRGSVLIPGGVPFGGEAWEVLAQTADLTPVLLRQEGQGLSVVAANFNPTQTDMVNRSAFPLLLTNAMNSFRNEASLTLGEPLPGGLRHTRRRAQPSPQPRHRTRTVHCQQPDLRRQPVQHRRDAAALVCPG